MMPTKDRVTGMQLESSWAAQPRQSDALLAAGRAREAGLAPLERTVFKHRQLRRAGLRSGASDDKLSPSTDPFLVVPVSYRTWTGLSKITGGWHQQQELLLTLVKEAVAAQSPSERRAHEAAIERQCHAAAEDRRLRHFNEAKHMKEAEEALRQEIKQAEQASEAQNIVEAATKAWRLHNEYGTPIENESDGLERRVSQDEELEKRLEEYQRREDLQRERRSKVRPVIVTVRLNALMQSS
eukprot:COSAG01_NODE_1042_length_11958_cov_10.203558_7_plen_240_part_00